MIVAEQQELGPLRRLGWLSVAWTLYVLSGPGALFSSGTPLGFVAVALWAWTARRPGRLRLLIEALVAGLALTSEVYWIAYVYWPALIYIGLGWCVYGGLRSVLLRRLGLRLRPALAVPLAWIGAETLRMTVPEPFGFCWLALGHRGSATPLLADSARLWGQIGIGFTLGALAGLLVERIEARRAGAPRPGWRGFAWGLGPLGVGVLAGFVFPVPQTEPGPRVLCVQPAFPQARKLMGPDPVVMFSEQIELTREGLAQTAEPPDLVCWGESMMPNWVAEPAVIEQAAELETDPWLTLPEGGLPEFLRLRAKWERIWVGEVLLGTGARPGVLPEGTAFASGVVYLVAREGRMRRTNSIVLWRPDFERGGFAAKSNLVPGAETLLGLEEFDVFRDFIYRISTYVPDFLQAEGTGVLSFEARDGRSYRVAGTVCYDNAIEAPYLQPLREGEVDFHLVVSNEAWYRGSWEVDQMLAFSRLLCIESGRAMVRATNSGISGGFGPDGAELAHLTVEGRDREVRGTLEVQVPVPLASAGPRAARPPYVWLEPWWRGLAILLPLLLALFSRRGTVTGPDRGSRAPHPGGAPPRA